MKKLNVNDFKEFKDFWLLEGKNINVVFSNAKMDRSFNRHTDEGILELENTDIDKIMRALTTLNN